MPVSRPPPRVSADHTTTNASPKNIEFGCMVRCNGGRTKCNTDNTTASRPIQQQTNLWHNLHHHGTNTNAQRLTAIYTNLDRCRAHNCPLQTPTNDPFLISAKPNHQQWQRLVHTGYRGVAAELSRGGGTQLLQSITLPPQLLMLPTTPKRPENRTNSPTFIKYIACEVCCQNCFEE